MTAEEGVEEDERPVRRYAQAPDGVDIAYQVTGKATLDPVLLPSAAVPIGLLWEDPGSARFAKRLCDFSRAIWCDARGIGEGQCPAF
jgi:hypothetical protein